MKLTAEEIESRLAEVRRSYLASLKEKITSIRSHWDALERRWDEEHYQALHMILHSLAGSAETFGLAEISQDARGLVQQLRQINASSDAGSNALAHMLADRDRLLSRMQAAQNKFTQ